MAINVNYNSAALKKPGAYSKTVVNNSGGFPLVSSGIVAIIGEASGGAPGAVEGVQTFTSEDIAALATKYVSGPIVDAARLLVSPGKDARVANGASLIRVYKTNQSVAAAQAIPNAAPVTLFNVASANFGASQNQISIKIEAGVANVAARIITVQKGTQIEVLPENANVAMLVIQYTGSAAASTATIQAGVLATSCTAVPADDLSISLSGKSIQELVDIINASAVYTCTTTLKGANARSASDLDPISTALDIKTATKTLRAQQKELLDIINGQSSLITASRVANVEGTIAAQAKKFMSGAALGDSANSDFQDGFDALLAARCNTVVPLISQDASALIALGLTDPASAFTVAAVNAQALSHCILASNTKNRSERNCYVSVKDSFANSQSAAQDLNHERASMLIQDVMVINSAGDLVWQDPWAAAAILAGVQAGMDPGTPATFKGINVNGIRHQDYNAKTQVDLAIEAGILPLEAPDQGGFRIVVQNSTYSNDANFVYNRPSVLAAADSVAYNLRQQLEAIYVGEKAKTGSAIAIKNSVIAIMSRFLDSELIVGDDTNNQLGWKDLIVNISGNVANIQVTITPIQGLDFLLNNLQLDNIQQSA